MKKQLLLIAASLLSAGVFAQTQRMVLYEEFTGENCGPCASTNPALNALLKQPINQQRVAAIKWEVPIPSAPSATWSLYQTNKTEINWRYRSTSAGGYGYPSQNTSSSGITSGINSAPSGRIDGQHQWTFGASSDHPANLSNSALASAAAVSAPFAINMTREWNSDASAINVTVVVTASQNFTATGALKFRTVMVERTIKFALAPGSNGEKDFDDVAIKSFPTIHGGTSLASNWTSGQTFSFTLNCPVPSYVRKKTEIAFVGFIQDDGDRKVHQAFRLEKEGLPYDAAAIAAQLEPVCSANMSPIVTVENKGVNPITTMTITPYTDGSAQNVTTWTGNLLPGNSTTVALSSFNAPTTAGAHTFSYNVTAIDGTDMDDTNNGRLATFVVATDYSSNPVVEGFGGSFPPANWTMLADNGAKPWVKSPAAGAYGFSAESMMMSFFNNSNVGEKAEIVLPPVDLSGDGVPVLDFVYAYAQ